jgi:hypothetical protein
MHAYALDRWIAIYYMCGENLRKVILLVLEYVIYNIYILKILLTVRDETSTTPVLGVLLCRNRNPWGDKVFFFVSRWE